MVPKKIKKEFKVSFVLLGLITLISYLLLIRQSPFFDSVQSRIYFVLMITSMTVFALLTENYVKWDKNSPEKLKERFKQITFILGIPFIFLVLTGWGYTFFLIIIMAVPLGLSLVEEIPIFYYVKITRKKILLTALIFVVLYFIAKIIYSAGLLEKETVYLLLLSHMISSIIANFTAKIKEIRKFNKKKKQ